jgi:pimeloyl-ACP methyl ester carboxylesterase
MARPSQNGRAEVVMSKSTRSPQVEEQAPQTQQQQGPASESGGAMLDQGNAAALEATGQSQGEQAGLDSFSEMIGEAFLDAEKLKIPTRHIIYEQLAHCHGYEDPGSIVVDQGMSLLDLGYVLVGRIDDPATGLQVAAFAPCDEMMQEGLPKPERPVVAFRGTEPQREGLQDIGTDFGDAGVGYSQFEPNEAEIAALMGSVGGCDVVGHSLGGALAQLAACRIGGVSEIVTFQSPGIDEDDLALLEEGVESTHYRVKGDVVDDAGEGHTEGEVVELDGEGLDGPLRHLSYLLVEEGNDRGIEGLHGEGIAVEGIQRFGTDEEEQAYEDIRDGVAEVGVDAAALYTAFLDVFRKGDIPGLQAAVEALGSSIESLASDLAEALAAKGEQLMNADEDYLIEQVGALLEECLPAWLADDLAHLAAPALQQVLRDAREEFEQAA